MSSARTIIDHNAEYSTKVRLFEIAEGSERVVVGSERPEHALTLAMENVFGEDWMDEASDLAIRCLPPGTEIAVSWWDGEPRELDIPDGGRSTPGSRMDETDYVYPQVIATAAQWAAHTHEEMRRQASQRFGGKADPAIMISTTVGP